MRNLFRLMAPDEGATGGGATPPAPAPAPSAAPAPAARAPAPGPAPAPSAAPPPAGDAPGYWPADWRARVAGEDAELVKVVGRYATPADLAKAHRNLQVKLSEAVPRLPKNPSAEELADFRKSWGIPETADKYDLDLGTGKVVGEVDKPLVDDFLKVAHSSNLNGDQTKAMLRTYFEIQDRVTEARHAEDQRIADESEEALRIEWGAEFRPNLNRVTQMLDRVGAPEKRDAAGNVVKESLKDLFLHGRLADGTPIGSSPDAMRMLLGVALMENPAGVLTPSGGSASGGVDDEIAKIERVMKTNRNAYTKDEKMQARYRDLIDAREKMKGLQKAA